MKHGFGDLMVRPRDPQFEADVLAWHFENNSSISETAKHFEIHRTTVGRWLAEYNNTDSYHRERFAQDTSNRVRIGGSYSIDFHTFDYDRLFTLSTHWGLTINQTINQILFLGLILEDDESE